MSAKKKVLKFIIVFILLIFLLSTGLISVLYLGGKKTPTSTIDGILTGDTVIETGVNLTGSVK